MNANAARSFLLAGFILALGGPAQSANKLPPGVTGQAVEIEILPVEMRPKGKPIEVVGWKDASGENMVVLSKSGEIRTDASGSRQSRLFATQLNRRHSDAGWTRVWALMDEVEPCQVDIVCSFVRGSLELTDLDKNGVAEVSFAYRLACVGDISPWGQKLMLFGNGRKFAVRGQTVQLDEDGRPANSSRMTMDKAFDEASPKFREFATKKWNRMTRHDLPLY